MSVEPVSWAKLPRMPKMMMPAISDVNVSRVVRMNVSLGLKFKVNKYPLKTIQFAAYL